MFGYYKFRKLLLKHIYLKRAQQRTRNFDFNKTNENLLLIANGYTLNETIDLSCLTNNDIFICNELFLHSEYNNLIQNNNVIHFAMDGIESFEQTIPRFEKMTTEEAYKKYLHPILVSPVIAIMPISLFQYISINFPEAKFIPSEIILKKLAKEASLDFKQLKEIKVGHTPQFMILLGILMGYKRISIYGLEHNYVKDILNKDPKCGTHFYGETYRQVLELNMGKDLPREAYRTKLSKLFEGNVQTFRTYEALAELAKEQSVEIIDHSSGSLFMFQDYSLWDLVEPKSK